ncbi:unnamed protein product, partial [Urochloa humidicola]
AVSRTIEATTYRVMAEGDDGPAMVASGDEDGEGKKGSTVGKVKGTKLKEIRDEAAIPEATPTRCSPCLVNSVDEHTMSNGERRAAERNLEHMEGYL